MSAFPPPARWRKRYRLCAAWSARSPIVSAPAESFGPVSRGTVAVFDVDVRVTGGEDGQFVAIVRLV